MSPALFRDPLTIRLENLRGISPILRAETPGYGTPGQRRQLTAWNGLQGIRVQAFQDNLLTKAENEALLVALDVWPWLKPAGRYNINCIMTMLFTIRGRWGFNYFDRRRLAEMSEFQIKSNQEPSPRPAWHSPRRSRVRRELPAGW